MCEQVHGCRDCGATSLCPSIAQGSMECRCSEDAMRCIQCSRLRIVESSIEDIRIIIEKIVTMLELR